MIDEILHMYNIRSISKFPEINNYRTRIFDLFRARIGTPMTESKLLEGWSTDNYTKKILGVSINPTAPMIYSTVIARAKTISRKAVFILRNGNVTTPNVAFNDAYFIIKVNGVEQYRVYGWNDKDIEFYWRMEGGEKIELMVYAPTTISMGDTEYIYAELVIHYEPENYILNKELGDNLNLNNGENE